MGDSDSDSGDEGTSLSHEMRSSNKRKFLSSSSPDILDEAPTMSVTESSMYDILAEKIYKALNELGSIMENSRVTDGEQEVQEDEQADWDDPIAFQLEEILTNNLFSTFCGAVKKIIECGYTEEAAERAVSNCSLFYGSRDAVPNVLDGALALLKWEEEFDAPKHRVFEGLQNLADYKLLEMINVLREIRPELTVAEAMWCLLISDLNLINACILDGGPTGGSCSKEAPRESPTGSQSKSETSDTGQSDSNKLDNAKQTTPRAQGSQPETPVAGPAHQPPNHKPSPGESASSFAQETNGKFSGVGRERSSQGMVVDGKIGGSRSGSSINSKREMLRQKPFHSEKNHKARLSKGAFKAKVAAWGNMVADKALKLQSGSSGVVIKGNYPKLTIPDGTNSYLMEGNHHLSSNSRSGVAAGASSGKDSVSTLPGVDSKSPGSSAPDTNPSPKGEIDVSDSPMTADYYASIPFDETLQQYVPKNDKDEAVLKLVPHKETLKKELQEWTNWANKKVMQAARRLGKDQGELKLLRQEREELEKLKKEKQSLEESTIKRLSEMEYKLSTTTGQIEVGNSTIRRLEEENSLLKEDMEAAKLQAIKAATNLQEALLREQEALRKLQSCDAEKGLVPEQLTNSKRQKAELVGRLEKAAERQNQFKVLLRHEEKEKLKIAAQIDSLRRKNEEDAALTKAEEDNIKQTAEKNMQKYKEDIKSLENMISELRLESDKAKIAALNVGYGSLAGENVSTFLGSQLTNISKKLPGFQDNMGDVKQERECVMCMSDEISVVFLPCAHQVLCHQCSVLHEKQGMDDCPSCRTTIQRRISVSYCVV